MRGGAKDDESDWWTWAVAHPQTSRLVIVIVLATFLGPSVKPPVEPKPSYRCVPVSSDKLQVLTAGVDVPGDVRFFRGAAVVSRDFRALAGQPAPTYVLAAVMAGPEVHGKVATFLTHDLDGYDALARDAAADQFTSFSSGYAVGGPWLAPVEGEAEAVRCATG